MARTVLITGSSSGIGLLATRLFAARGWQRRVRRLRGRSKLAAALHARGRLRGSLMRFQLLCSVVVICATTAFAQTNLDKTVTLTGCVGAGADAKAITLSNALVLPVTGERSSAEAPPPPAPVATIGASGSAAEIGASGVITGTAPAGSSASSASGYRLSGTDMTAWLGRRVQIVGTLVPAPVTKAKPDGSATAPMAELRVQSVQPITGSCPKP
jgi:NAD(P)-dependent dehydrogenase (short-subunit alcohol dehydrogenase family)